MSDEPALALADFAVHHRRGPQAAVEDVNLTLRPGEAVLVVGGEASGKTSLLRGILGLVPHRGAANVLGGTPGDATSDGRIGFAPEGRPFPPELKVRELVALIAQLRRVRDPKAVDDAIEITGLGTHSRSRLSTLDVEHARRASLACAAVGAPDLILLDDPWESPETIAVLDQARERGAAAVIATAVPGGFRNFVDTTIELADGAPT